MREVKILKTALTLLLIFTLVSVPFVVPAHADTPTEPHAADAIWVEPSLINLSSPPTLAGYKFNVTIWINLTESSAAWEFKLSYNKNYLNATRTGYTAGSTSDFFRNLQTMSLAPSWGSINSTFDYLLCAESWMSGPTRDPGYGSLSWVEFRVMSTPPAGVTYSTLIGLEDVYPAGSQETYAQEPDGTKITLNAFPSNYIISGPGAPVVKFTLNVTSTAGGLTNATGATQYANGTVVYVLATANVGYFFDSWLLNSTNAGSANPIQITMNASYNLQALFTLAPTTGCKLYVDPAEIIDLTMGPSHIFAINVTAENFTDIQVCTFNMTYDPQILDWVGLDFLQAQGEYPTASITGNGAAGFTWISLYYTTPISLISSTPLITMRFHVHSYGISPLSLTDTELLNSTGNPVDHIEFDGFFANIIRDVAVTNVVPEASWVYQTWKDNINVTVANLGNVTENFTASALYDSNVIGTAPITNLAPNTETTVQFLWDTTGVPVGNYTITGTASLVPYETYFNTTNNIYVDSIVQVIAAIHDVAITNITTSTDWAYQGWPVSVQVTASNLGNVSEAFNVTAYYDNNTIDMIPIANLPSKFTTVLTFNWNTTGLAEKNYTISAFASYVQFEYNTTNNYLADGQVLILTQIRDIAVTNATLSRTWAYQGMLVNITVTAKNVGDVSEPFNLMAFYGTNLLGNVSISGLAPGATISQTFTLNTSLGVKLYRNFTISGQEVAQYDYNTSNNVFIDGNLTVRLVGDVNGDGKVRIDDILAVTQAYGSQPGDPRWNPYTDINGDGRIRVDDVLLAALNFGKTYTDP
jgi:hypothetical protein